MAEAVAAQQSVLITGATDGPGRKPKARYGVTPLATLLKWAKRLLPDSAIDAWKHSHGKRGCYGFETWKDKLFSRCSCHVLDHAS